MILNCVYVCRYVPMSAGTQGGQRHCIHLELELQIHVNQQIVKLGLEFWSPGRTAHSFTPPPPNSCCFMRMKIKRNISDQKQVKSPGKDGLRSSEKRLFFSTAWVLFDFKSRELGWSEEKQQRSRFQREWDMRPSAWGSEILLPIVYAHPVWVVFFFFFNFQSLQQPCCVSCHATPVD